jgi:hypothetical protein
LFQTLFRHGQIIVLERDKASAKLVVEGSGLRSHRDRSPQEREEREPRRDTDQHLAACGGAAAVRFARVPWNNHG